MNQINLSTTAGKVFFASLLGYCLAFSGFYITTQYAINRIEFEEQQGAFLSFNDAICEHGKLCNDIEYSNVYLENKAVTQIKVRNKNTGSTNVEQMQKNYALFMDKLPWFVQMQFEKEMKVMTVNGKSYKAN